jgi:probable rRNA maturation factor
MDNVLRARRRRGEVNLVFVTDQRMAQLNHQYRGKQGTTDVLSFNLDEEGEKLQAEIYISLPRARKQALEFGHSPSVEILKLTCHGLLHLCGVHHPDDRARARMLAAERRYLTQLEVGS